MKKRIECRLTHCYMFGQNVRVKCSFDGVDMGIFHLLINLVYKKNLIYKKYITHFSIYITHFSIQLFEGYARIFYILTRISFLSPVFNNGATRQSFNRHKVQCQNCCFIKSVVVVPKIFNASSYHYNGRNLH